MDVDTQEPAAAELIDYFDLSPEGFAWRGSRPHDIETRRADMADQLIFDILLARGGIREPDALWPPHDPAGLHRLLDAIQNSSYDTLKNDCLVYFLLKWHQDGREGLFAQELVIPPQFVAITDAYWHLDSGIDPARAVSLLSDARVHREYSSKVIQALSLSHNPSPLVVRFVRTVKPALDERSDIDAYTLALAETSFMEAWFYQRTYPDEDSTRKRLLRKIIQWCISPVQPAQLKQVLSLPMSPYEQSVLHDLALQPPQELPPSSVSLLQDIVCTRLIQAGALSHAVVMDRRFRNAPGAVPADARRQMIDEVLSIIPAIDRIALDEELLSIGSKQPARSFSSNLAHDTSLSNSMSWEAIPPSGSSASVSSLPKKAPRKSFDNQPVHIGGRKSFPFAQNGHPSPLSASKTKPASPTPIKQSPFAPKKLALSITKPTSIPFAAPDDNPFAVGAKPIEPSPFGPRRSIVESAFPLSPNASASMQPNAFFNPPTAKVREPSPPPVHDEDADMGAYTLEVEEVPEPEPEVEPEPEREPEAEEYPDTEEDIPAAVKLAREVFGSTSSKPARSNRRNTHEIPHEPPSPSTSPPPAKTQATRATRKGRSRLPGAFEQEDDEEEDEVPPLPPSPTKRGRRTRSSAAVDAATRPTRRSSRLSVASSSPEPASASPKKSTTGRKTKTSMSASAASGSAGPSAGRTRASRKR